MVYDCAEILTIYHVLATEYCFRNVDLHSHYSSHLLREISSFCVIFLFFYNICCVPECVPEDLSNPRAATQGDVMATARKQKSGTGNQPGEQNNYRNCYVAKKRIVSKLSKMSIPKFEYCFKILILYLLYFPKNKPSNSITVGSGWVVYCFK